MSCHIYSSKCQISLYSNRKCQKVPESLGQIQIVSDISRCVRYCQILSQSLKSLQQYLIFYIIFSEIVIIGNIYPRQSKMVSGNSRQYQKCHILQKKLCMCQILFQRVLGILIIVCRKLSDINREYQIFSDILK